MYLFLYIYVCVFYIPLFMQPEIFAPTVSLQVDPETSRMPDMENSRGSHEP